VPNIMQNTMPRKLRRAASRVASSLPGNGSACARGGGRVGRQVGAAAKKPAAFCVSEGQ
jgi:hypothetical protein